MLKRGNDAGQDAMGQVIYYHSVDLFASSMAYFTCRYIILLLDLHKMLSVSNDVAKCSTHLPVNNSKTDQLFGFTCS